MLVLFLGAGISFILFEDLEDGRRVYPRLLCLVQKQKLTLKNFEFMSEQKLLTERQISRRKTAAIWLIGIGILLELFRPYMFTYLFQLRVLDERSLSSVISIYSYITLLLVFGGLMSVKRFENRRISDWSKRWGIAYLALGLIPILWDFGIFPSLTRILPDIDLGVVLPLSVRSLTSVIIFFYMLATIDMARRNSDDDTVRKYVRILQSVLFLKISQYSIIWIWQFKYAILDLDMHNGNHFLDQACFFIKLLNSVLPFVLFFGIRGLIRSSLFASTPTDIEAFAAQPMLKSQLLSAPVCGAVIGVLFCIAGTWLFTTYWNQIYI